MNLAGGTNGLKIHKAGGVFENQRHPNVAACASMGHEQRS